MRRLDARLGRGVEVPQQDDPMLVRTGVLGDVHEQRVLADLEARLGPAVRIERPTVFPDDSGSAAWRDAVDAAAERTLAALRDGASLIHQGAFFDGGFQGYADFLVLKEDAGDGPVHEVWDSKLARSAKITAILQVAAYTDQLQRSGVPTGRLARLVLGNGTQSIHDVSDVIPVYLDRRRHPEGLVAHRLEDDRATPWNDERYVACGRCEVCAAEIERHEDVLLVAGLSLRQRQRLRHSGIETLSEFATAKTSAGVPSSTFQKLQQQAALQLEARRHPGRSIPYRVTDRGHIDLLPAADPGDLFFDFEGDPLYEEKGRWGIDYLFGTYGDDVAPENDDRSFIALWAEDLAGERQAFIAFMALLAERRRRYPGMHVYHYASYEKTHLLSIAARHQLLEDEVDDLLRDGVLVDLLTTVRRSLRVGTDSYSIKSLEPLYMGDETRTGTAKAADSVEEFARYVDARDAGESDDATAIRADIVQYNRYDCRSTAKLRDWLLSVRTEGAQPPPKEVHARDAAEPDPLTVALLALIDGVPVEDRTPTQTAVAIAAAAVDYHRRENKKFWQEHYGRLEDDEGDWAEQRGVVSIGEGEAVVLQDWHKPTPGSGLARVLEVSGTIAPGSSIKDGAKGLHLLYDEPYPDVASSPVERRDGMRLGHNRTELARDGDSSVLVVTEKLGKGGTEHALLPMAITPSGPFATKSIVDAIRDWGEGLLAHLEAAPSLEEGAQTFDDAAFDVLLRRAPLAGAPVPVTEGQTADAIVASLIALDRGTLAVQGPPGTGKTYTGSHVIAQLVARGWKVGVVAQSHSTVENMLDAIVEADVAPGSIGKALKDPKDSRPRPWTVLQKGEIAAFVAEAGGRVVGGTAWTLTNRNQIAVDELDLLVIDEAGQFSLANTIAVSSAARRMLLLGDPQQLPQVTQGSHPEPVDASALGWLADGHDVLPDQYGYFLAETWRMVAEMCEPVSQLSYAGRLRPAAGAKVRHLESVRPGLHPVPIRHSGNDTSSSEEASEVVRLIRSLIGREWTEHRQDEAAISRPLDQSDVSVVAAYNAQVDLLSSRLRAASLDRVEVGTVDRFQGREAAVSMVSLAASSAEDVPRGLEFLLMPNRLNVAISRAKWAAFLVHSPDLSRHLPSNPLTLGMLGKFLRLVTAS